MLTNKIFDSFKNNISNLSSEANSNARNCVTNFTKKFTANASNSEDNYTCFAPEGNGESTKCEDSNTNFILKNNYDMQKVLSGGVNYSNIKNVLNSGSSTFAELQKDKARGPVYIKSDKLTDEESKKAREEAIKLLEERINTWDKNRPDYGDVRSYYNYGSVLDWVLTHPVSFALKGFSDTFPDLPTSKLYNSIYKSDLLGGEGCFSPLNIVTNVEKLFRGKNENGVREDYFTESLSVRSVYNIDNDVEDKKNLLKSLKENINNPEKFAELYYKMTDGANFDAERVLEYINDKSSYDEDLILGRNYIGADYKKNKYATEAAYNANKTVGTVLCKMIPFGGPAIACAANTAVSEIEENTKKDNKMTPLDHLKLVLSECGKSVAITNGAGIASKIFSKTNLSSNGLLSKIAENAVKETIVNSSNLTGNILTLNKSAIGDVVKLYTNPKTTGKAIFNVAKSVISSIFKK